MKNILNKIFSKKKNTKEKLKVFGETVSELLELDDTANQLAQQMKKAMDMSDLETCAKLMETQIKDLKQQTKVLSKTLHVLKTHIKMVKDNEK